MSLEPLHGDRVRETYRYLRIGLIGAAVLLAVSVILERLQVDCWQGSISAYYYTPARAVIVGSLVAVGLSLIVIKGIGLEDLTLNVAGLLAPVVAFVPTRNVGTCWSIQPEPLPVVPMDDPNDPGQLADWVVANIENNMWALIITGILGLVLAYTLLALKEGPARALKPTSKQSELWLLAIIVAVFALALSLWDGFADHAHNIAAIGMFIFLALSSAINARRQDTRGYKWLYASVAFLMAAAPVIILGLAAVLGDRWDHSVLVLETVEIALFVVYWSAQTLEHWNEPVMPQPTHH